MRQGSPWADLKDRDFLPPHDAWLGPGLAPFLASLTIRQKQTLYLRFVLGLRQAEAAEVLGVNQQRISAVERQALSKLKTLLPRSIARRFAPSPGKSRESRPASRGPSAPRPASA